jgi:hypothetical protein
MREPKPHARFQSFVLRLEDKIPWRALPNRGLFAVYDAPLGPYANRLFIAKGLGDLRHGLREFQQRGRIPGPDAFVQTARTTSDFPDLDRERIIWENTQRCKWLKARYGHTAWLQVRAAIERKGTRPGPKRRECADWKIRTLQMVSKGVPFEDAIENPARKHRLESARVEIWRYCREFHDVCQWTGLNTPEEWQKPKAAQYLHEHFGLQFPHDLKAAREAFHRGTPSAHN